MRHLWLICFNTLIKRDQFPDSWRLARVTPIFQEGEKTVRSNYRPISVLPVVAKLFEKLVTNQLHQHMNDNGYLSPDQSGSLRFHSTVTCLLKSTDDWYNGLDLGEELVFIGLKKQHLTQSNKASFVKAGVLRHPGQGIGMLQILRF